MIAYGAEEKISLPWAFENVYVTFVMMGATFNPERISTKIIFGWFVGLRYIFIDASHIHERFF